MFQTADGYINIAASGDNLWKKFCEVAGDKELPTNPDFATVPLRAKNRAALIAHLNDLVRSKPERLLGRGTEQGRRAVRPDQHDRPGLGRPAGASISAWRRPVDHPKIGTYDVVGQPIHMSALSRSPTRCARPPTRASTPTRSCANSATATPRSPRCGRSGWCSRKLPASCSRPRVHGAGKIAAIARYAAWVTVERGGTGFPGESAGGFAENSLLGAVSSLFAAGKLPAPSRKLPATRCFH